MYDFNYEINTVTCILGQMRVPTPFSLLALHCGGTWPQFNLQDMRGTGIPTLSHVRISVSPTFSFLFEGDGGLVMCTGAED